jgi:hypothetical protein
MQSIFLCYIADLLTANFLDNIQSGITLGNVLRHERFSRHAAA